MLSVDPDPPLSGCLLGPEPLWEPRVLVVDDDDVSRRVAAGLLQTLGFPVEVAADGREALAMILRWPYVAIFMDCGMPQLDGYGATRQLRAREGRTSHTTVIAMTCKPRSVSLASGMDHHLTKPLELDVLRADCRRLGLIARGGVGSGGPIQTPRLRAPLLDAVMVPEAATAPREPLAGPSATFIRDAVARLPEIWRAVNFGDVASCRTIGEDLRRRADAAGAPRLAELCERLGQSGRDGTTEAAAEIERQLRNVLFDTDAAIGAYLDGGPVAPAAGAGGGIGAGLRLATAPPRSPLEAAGIARLQSQFGPIGVLPDLVALFALQTPTRLSDMRRYLARGDAAAVSADAHQLKGGCLTLAAVEMAELCDELEVTAGDGSLEGAPALLDQIEMEFVRALAALGEIL